MSTNKKISIIIVMKNEMHYLLSVLQHFHNGICKPSEIIVVDGNMSNDNDDAINTIKNKYDFKYIKNEQAMICKKYDSPFGAFVEGIKHATNEYVSLWSVDDIPYNSYIYYMECIINEYSPHLVICSSDVLREDKQYERTLLPFDSFISRYYLVKKYKDIERKINLVGSVIRKSHVTDCITHLTKANFDCTYFYYTAFKYGFFNIGKPLILYRSYLNSHGQKGSWKNIKEWLSTCREKFITDKEVYSAAIKARFFEHYFINYLMLKIVPFIPLWIRRIIYNNIYRYNQKDEKI